MSLWVIFVNWSLMSSKPPNILIIFIHLQSESMVLETADHLNNGNPSPLEALLAGAEGFPPMLDIPPDADDETMVELAIALSLQQEQQGKLPHNQTSLNPPGSPILGTDRTQLSRS